MIKFVFSQEKKKKKYHSMMDPSTTQEKSSRTKENKNTSNRVTGMPYHLYH